MSNVAAPLTLIEVCFPDCTQKVIRAWGQVLVTAGTKYVTGGIPMGLIKFADDRTVDFNGFLRCDVWDEEVQSPTNYITYHYSPVGDVLQAYIGGTEVANGTTFPLGTSPIDPDKPETQTEAVLLMFEASWDRTTVRG